jgi:hypothetical protein
LRRQFELHGKRYNVTNESLLVRFFRFLVMRLPNKSVKFDISNGAIKYYRAQTKKSIPLIRVKDPFLRFENHGYSLKDEAILDRVIRIHKRFIHMASIGELEEFLSDNIYQF